MTLSCQLTVDFVQSLQVTTCTSYVTSNLYVILKGHFLLKYKPPVIQHKG